MKNYIKEIEQNWKSGLSVALIAIPLSISLSVASGGTPIQGIITAIRGCLFAGIFGGSKYNIFGPAGALSGLLLAFVLINGSIYLPFVAIATGVFVLIFASIKITKYITLIPSTALHGFILGVALIIATTQLNGAFGLSNLTKHSTVFGNFIETLSNIQYINWGAFILFICSLGILLLRKKFIKSIPGIIPISILGISLGILNNKYGLLNIDILQDNFNNLKFFIAQFPSRITLKGLTNNIDLITNIIKTGFTIAIIAILETIISAKIADRMTKTKFDQKKEIKALGISNIVSGFMGGLPTTAVLLRTAINIKTGAQSKASAIISSIFVLIISAFFFSFFKYMPIAVISAILINTAIGMIDIYLYKKIRYYEKKSLIILLIVAIITLIEDPIYGILIGTAISLLIYIKNTSNGDICTSIFRNGKYIGKTKLAKYIHQQNKGDIIICKFSGEINFINMSSEIDQIAKLNTPSHVIFSFSQLNSLDIDGMEAIEEMFEHLQKNGMKIYFSGIDEDIEKTISKMPIYKTLQNTNHIYSTSSQALEELNTKK